MTHSKAGTIIIEDIKAGLQIKRTSDNQYKVESNRHKSPTGSWITLISTNTITHAKEIMKRLATDINKENDINKSKQLSTCLDRAWEIAIIQHKGSIAQ